MAAPLIAAGVVVAVAAVGAIANYLNSEESRKLASSERKRLEEMIDKLQSPKFDISMLSPPELRLLETYTPQVAEMVYEAAPELVTVSERGRMGQAAQDAALARFQQIASGTAPGANLEVIAALDEAMQRGGQQRDAILADMSRQGLTPSSSAYANLQYGAANQTQKNMFLTSLQAALADRQRRDTATSQAANIGQNIAGAEIDLEKYNDTVINQLNQRNTQARRQYLQDRAEALNKASLYNMAKRQSYNDQNLNNLYQAQVANQELRNKQIAATYDNERSKLGMKSGVSQGRVSDIFNQGKDRSNMISGLTNAGMTAAMMYGMKGPQQKPEPTNYPEPNYNGKPPWADADPYYLNKPFNPSEELPYGTDNAPYYGPWRPQ